MNSNKKQKNKAEWIIPTLLIVLSLVPVLAGAARLSELASGAKVTPDNARFFASPLPVVIHIVSVTLYSMLGALQFTPGFRQAPPGGSDARRLNRVNHPASSRICIRNQPRVSGP